MNPALNGNHRPFRFGALDVDPARNRISKNKTSVTVEPRAMDLLCHLAQHRDQVVSRDTLIDNIWKVDFGADESLTRAMSVLRKTIRDCGVKEEYIETIPKRGYRLIMPISRAPEQDHGNEDIAPDGASTNTIPPHTEGRRSRKPHRAFLILALIASLLLSIVAVQFINTSSDQEIPERSVAVLPFKSMSVEMNDELFAEGLAEELLNTLAAIDDLKVASRTSSFVYKDRSANIQEIGKTLGVSYVLEGSLRRSGNRVRITAQLISIEDGYHHWADTYDREIDDIFNVQDDIARRVATALNSELVGGEDSLLFNAGTQSATAFNYYLEGRKYLNRRGLGMSRAISNFENAINTDPDYARAYAGLATSHAVSHIYLNVPQELSRTRARSAARMALSIDPTLSEPYAALGVIEADQNNWQAAVDYYEKGEAINPNDVVLLQWHAEVLLYIGYLDLAEKKIEKALALDPGSAVLNLVAGNIAQNIDDLDAAENYYRRASDLGLTNGLNDSAFIDFRRGNIERAAQLMAVTSFNDQRIGPDDVEPLRSFYRKVMKQEVRVDDVVGEFPALAEDDDFLMPAYLMAGESENALKILEADPDGDHDSFYQLWTETDPNLRQHPYFKIFVRNVGLYDYWLDHGWPDKCKSTRTGTQDSFECE